MPFIPSITAQFLNTTQRTGFTHIFSRIDPFWAMFVVISLLGMLLSYDTFSGEKEDRSLPMLLSGATPRPVLFVGKYLGILVILCIPLVLGVILSVLTLTVMSPELIKGSDWFRILTAFLILCLNGSIFVTIGMVISGLTHRSATSLISLAFLWVLLVILVPIGSIYLARSVRPMLLGYLVERTFKDQYRDADLHNEPRFRLPEKEWLPLVGVGWFPPYGIYRLWTPLPQPWMDELALFYNEKIPELESLAREMRNSVGYYEEEMKSQTVLITWLDRLSPVGVSRHLADSILGTDFGAFDYFLNRCRRYRETVIAYVRDKLSVNPYRVISPFDIGTLPSESEYVSQLTGGKYDDLRVLLNSVSGAPDQREAIRELAVGGRGRRPETEPLELDDLPAFDHQPEPLSVAMGRSMLDLGILIAYQMLLLMVGLFLITRYDPR
jgi:ABC-type transport system involved in multi-copper enzyme maturation permease subunit